MNLAPSCFLITDLEGLNDYFSCLSYQGLCRVYIKLSTCNHMFTILANCLDLKKCCRNYGELLQNGQNMPN